MRMLSRAALLLSAVALCAPAIAQTASPTITGLPTVAAPGANDFVEIIGPNGRRVVPAGALAASGQGSSASTPLNVSAIGRDSAGRVTSFTSSNVPYTVTYDSFGPATIAGGGKTTTVSRDGNGSITGIATQ